MPRAPWRQADEEAKAAGGSRRFNYVKPLSTAKVEKKGKRGGVRKPTPQMQEVKASLFGRGRPVKGKQEKPEKPEPKLVLYRCPVEDCRRGFDSWGTMREHLYKTGHQLKARSL